MALPSLTIPDRDSKQERFSVGWTAVLVSGLMLVGAVATIKATNKPLWFDELFTLTIAKLQPVAEMMRALRVPIDIMPPPYYLICQAMLPLASDEHVGIRLPSLCGYLVAIASVYAFLAYRVDRISALTGAAFVACTALADYAYEARPYALMTGAIGCAACAWQRIDRSWGWAAALAGSLALAVSSHYYAVFAWPAFAIAELLVTLCQRRIRLRVWLALAIGLVPFVMCWPLLAAFRDVFGKTWWSPPRFAMVLLVPQELFKWKGGMWGPAVAAALAAMCMAWIVRSRPLAIWPTSVWLPPSPLTVGECGLAVGLLALPIIAVVVARITQGGLTVRYMMPAIIGAAIAIGGVTSTAPAVFRAMALTIMLLDFALAERPALVAWAKGNLLDARTAACETWEQQLEGVDDGESPIVVSDGLRYVQNLHYGKSGENSRALSIAEPALAVKLAASKSDVIDRSLLLIRPYMPVRVSGYDEFISGHDDFFLCSTDHEHEWLPAKLLQDGHVLAVVARRRWGTIYKATIRKP